MLLDLVSIGPPTIIILSGCTISPCQGEAAGFSLLRTMRLLKLVKVLRLVKMFSSLYVICSGVTDALRPLLWVCLLICIVLYVAAVFVTVTVGHNPVYDSGDFDRKRYFGSIVRSMFTLFQIVTLDRWSDVVRPVVEGAQPAMLFFFLLVIFVVTFGLLNVLMGIIAEHTITLTTENEELAEVVLMSGQKEMVRSLMDAVVSLGDEEDGVFTPEKIRSHAAKAWAESDLHGDGRLMRAEEVEYLVAVCEMLRTPVEDGKDTFQVSTGELLGAAVRMRGPAQGKDMLGALFAAKGSYTRVVGIEKRFAELESEIRSQNSLVDQAIHNLCNREAATEYIDRMGRMVQWQHQQQLQHLRNVKRNVMKELATHAEAVAADQAVLTDAAADAIDHLTKLHGLLAPEWSMTQLPSPKMGPWTPASHSSRGPSWGRQSVSPAPAVRHPVLYSRPTRVFG